MLLRDAEAQLGAPAVEALRRDFAAIKQELAHSCGREQDALERCAAEEAKQQQARMAAAPAPPEPDDAGSIIADCRWASGHPCAMWLPADRISACRLDPPDDSGNAPLALTSAMR